MCVDMAWTYQLDGTIVVLGVRCLATAVAVMVVVRVESVKGKRSSSR